MARRAGQPSVRSRPLAGALRACRIKAGLSVIDVAQATGMDASKITRVEKMNSGIYRDQFEKLLDLYNVTGPDRAELLGYFHHAEERGWLSLRGDRALPEDWQTWTEVEAEATSARNYEPLIIPGLLQTAEYARAIILSTAVSGLSDSEVDKFVASRMTRQMRLSHAHPLTLHAIIEESVLARTFGDVDVQARQLRHLVESASRPNITIQVLPNKTGLHPALYGSFVILDYADKTKLVHIEVAVSSLFLDKDDQIAIYTRTWTELTKRAHNPEESIKLISAIATQKHRKN
jgi:transcriptional regulator with XRE-family HTH domain